MFGRRETCTGVTRPCSLPSGPRVPTSDKAIALRALPSRGASNGMWDDPLWYKTAVFYELYVRGFQDGSGDGSGDFRGLTERLDYLQWLGIDCVWLLPIFPSPLRDGGY